MTISLKQDPHLDAESLYQFLKQRLNGKYELQKAPRRQIRRQEAIHGTQWVVIVGSGKLKGAFLLVDQRSEQTRVKVWTDPPSDGVFLTFVRIPILLPLLIFVLPIVNFGSAPIIREVRACLKELQ